MSPSNNSLNKRAVALRYEEKNIAPVIVASGMGYMAEKIVEVASQNEVPIYEDNSLATLLSQLELGQTIPPELYKVVVDIYVYFLNLSPEAIALKRKKEEEMLEAARKAARESEDISENMEN